MIRVSARQARELQLKLADYRSRMLYDIRSLESLTVARLDQLDKDLADLLKNEKPVSKGPVGQA
jgi:hypothetical protein